MSILSAAYSFFPMPILPDAKTRRKAIVLNQTSMAALKAQTRQGSYVISGDHPKTPRADLQKPWAAVCRHTGLVGLRIHDLRHTFEKHLIEKPRRKAREGMDVKLLAQDEEPYTNPGKRCLIWDFPIGLRRDSSWRTDEVRHERDRASAGF